MSETGNGKQQAFVELEPGSEWRFELEADEDIAVRVQSPEPLFINSAEIPSYTWYHLAHGLKSSIYAPEGGRIEVSSMPVTQYISTTTTQPALTTLHLALEKQRLLARRSGDPQIAPRVMVLGPPGSGKSTVVKSLVNMACSSGMGWSVGVVGLDPASPSNLIPGALSLSTPNQPIPTHHLAQPLGSPVTSVPANTMSADIGTAGWWYGHLEPSSRSVDLWEKLVTGMGDALRMKFVREPNAACAGLIMDTPAAFATASTGVRKTDPKARYPLVQHAVQTFGINTILVIGHEKLSIDITRLFSSTQPPVAVIRFPKSGGVVDRDDATREAEHAQMVRSYFYGEPPVPAHLEGLMGKSMPRELGLTPYSFQIGWETLSVLRVGEENAAPTTALPLGSSRILSPTRLTRVDPTGPAHVIRLLNTVLAVVALQPGDRIKPEKAIKAEPEAEASGVEQSGEADEGVKEEGQGETAEEEEDEEEEVPYLEEIGWREVLGFVVITQVDTIRKKYTVLSPSPGKLPSKVAIAGAIEWVDSA